jgi:predicted ATP-grasp superfamily ATP-dependent carboligase
VRLLIIEFITAGGCHDSPLPAALAAEGELMLQAVLRDARELSDVQVTVPRDYRVGAVADWANSIIIDGDPWPTWCRLIVEADAVLAIAPETDGVLHRLNSLVVAQGTRLLGCSPTAVAITASKLGTAVELKAHGVMTPATGRADEAVPAGEAGWIVKPDDGVGSSDVWVAASEAELRQRLSQVQNPIVQPCIAGVPLSLSLLCTSQTCRVLACNRQLQTCEKQRLRQVGVEVNGAHQRSARLSPVATSLFAAIPGLRGYVGVDLILTSTGAVVIEINPRLTTAYAGLSESIGHNALDLILRACNDDDTAMTMALMHKPVNVRPQRHD